jgi:hypothetical protein
MILFVDVCRGLKASRWDFSGEDDATPVRMPVAVRWKRSSEWNDHPGIFLDPLDGATWLFYQGNDDQAKSWYLSKRRIEWNGHIPRPA